MILLGGAKGKLRLHVPHRRRRRTSPPTISFHSAGRCELSHCTSAATLSEPSSLFRLQGVFCPRKTGENRALGRQCQNKNLTRSGRSACPTQRFPSHMQKKGAQGCLRGFGDRTLLLPCPHEKQSIGQGLRTNVGSHAVVIRAAHRTHRRWY